MIYSDDQIKHIENTFKQINRLNSKRRLKRALSLCEQLFEDFPEHHRVLHGFGALLFRTGMRERGEELLKKALEVKPDYADAHFNLGNVYKYSWRLNEAECSFQRALEIDPSHYKALANLAPVMCKQKKWQEAKQYCDRAIMLHPKLPEAYFAKGSVMMENGKSSEALVYYKKAFSIRPKNEAHSAILFIMNLLPEFTQRQIFVESKAWAERYAEPLTKKSRPHLNSPIINRKLRLGYVSGDFKMHPVSYHLAPVLAAHDTNNFEVFLYNSFPNVDEMTEKLSGYAQHYRDISTLTDEQFETVVCQDGIDILVDLSGHTGYHRLALFARKPSPVQVSWLGYFNTTGMTAMDYLLSDPITVQPEQIDLFAEKVVLLPDGRFCYEAPSFAPEVANSPALRNGYITFGSFNKLSKINPEVINLWARVLHSIPESRMILKWSSFDNEEMRSEILLQFEKHGVSSNRLIFRSDSPHPELLAEYGDVDIALDTFPYNGGATTCEALWMGVPVVTLAGATPIGRQSKAFLHAIGYPEWVAETSEEYITIAASLACDKEGLSGIRNRLRQQMKESPLCDGKRFAANLEAAYRSMWKYWCQNNQSIIPTPMQLKRFSEDELYNAGVVCLDDGDFLRAVQYFQATLRRNRRHYQANNNLGISLMNSGRTPDAIKAFKRAIANSVDDGKAYNNLGRLYLESGQSKRAYGYCKKAAELMPEHVGALINYGIACKDKGRIGKAREIFESVLQIAPDDVIAMVNLANVLVVSGQTNAAVEQIRRAQSCEPENIDVLSTLSFYLQYIAGVRNSELFGVAKQFESKLLEKKAGVLSATSQPCSGGKEHLRIGLVSADFRSHPVGMLLRALFMHYNPERLSLYCYSNNRWNDGLTEWYKANCAAWRDITSLDDDEFAMTVQNDGIDILIDLSGHTNGNRLSAFHLRPAPVQVTWLGHGFTTGLTSIDYIVADKDFIPPADEVWFSEKVVRMPHSRFCFVPPEPSPFVVDPPFLDNDFITFGCFNNLGKISPEALSVWAEILQRVPKSRLILKSKAFSDSGTRNWYRNEFKKYGVNPRRIELRRDSIHYFMLMEYGEIDISLDPFPFSGGMTSLEALWMGVPIITLAGELPISRQTESFLKLVGFEDLVATDLEEYVAKSVSLANNQSRLCEIRDSLRTTMLLSPLCDAKGYTAAVEQLFFSMWQEKCDGLEFSQAGKEQHPDGNFAIGYSLWQE